MTQPTNPPAGWYPDPDNRGAQRYWDGAAWTKHTAPLAGAVPAALVSPAADAASPRAWWQTWWAILPGLLLCAPLGLVGLWLRRGTGVKAKGLITAAVALMIALAMVSPSQSATTHPTPVTATTATPRTTAPASRPAPRPEVHFDAVPRLVGSSRAAAHRAIIHAGLTVGLVSSRASRKAPGTVLAQVPAPGHRLRPRSNVDLVVAALPPRVPYVRGMAKRRAISRLTTAGFIVTITRHDISYGRNGLVLRQRPTAGTHEMPGSPVRLVISVLHTPPPAPSPTPTPGPAPAPAPSCTTTSSGTCIRGGEFCPQADYGTTGYDADGRAYTCTGDTTHPHWE